MGSQRPHSLWSSEPKTGNGAVLWLGLVVLLWVFDFWAIDRYESEARAVPALLRSGLCGGMCLFLLTKASFLTRVRSACLMSALALLILCGFARVLGDWGDAVSTYSKLLRYLYPPVVFLTACAIGGRGRFSENWAVMAGLAVLLVVGSKMGVLHQRGELKTKFVQEAEDPTLQSRENMGYSIVCCAPLLLWGARRRVPPTVAASLVVCVALALIAGKRGAIVALAGGILTFLAIQMRDRWRMRIQLVAVVIAVGLVGGFFFAQHRYALADDWRDVEDPDRIGSGRGVIYRAVLQGWFDASPVQMVVGRGLLGAMEVTYERLGVEMAAHSDVLEVLSEHGLVGLAVYLAFFWELIKLYMWAVRGRHPAAGPFGAALAMILLPSLYSMALVSQNAVLTWLALGLGAGAIASARWQIRGGWIRHGRPAGHRGVESKWREGYLAAPARWTKRTAAPEDEFGWLDQPRRAFASPGGS